MKSHANRGKAFEKFLENIFYASSKQHPEKFAFLRTPPEMKVIRSIGRGQFISAFCKKGPPDYILSYQQITILADAKEVKGSRFPYANLHWNQANHFDRWEKCGNTAILIIRFLQKDYTSKDYVVPWNSIRENWFSWNEKRNLNEGAKRGSASISLNDLEEISFKFSSNTFLNSLDMLIEESYD